MLDKLESVDETAHVQMAVRSPLLGSSPSAEPIPAVCSMRGLPALHNPGAAKRAALFPRGSSSLDQWLIMTPARAANSTMRLGGLAARPREV
jgi:hypothetical protein